MAILSALFTLLGRQLTTILQAIFGWSITALFGKLPSKKQTALSVALGISVIWPLLVLGCFLPAAASWALAFLPLHKWMSDFALRILWISLAVTLPLAVGAVTRWITPKEKLHGGLVVTLLGGYVMTVGYFVAFIVTAITVPIIKAMSAVRKWDDCHVYIQPKEGRYEAVLEALVKACERGRVKVAREDVPAPMALATNVMQTLAKPFLEPSVDAKLQRLRGENLELYLYPADLLLRGEPHVLAHVRAAMTRTELAKHAYLVETPDAQKLQDEVETLWEGRNVDGDRDDMRAKLGDLSRRLDRASISFEEWTTLETSLRRVEHVVTGETDLLEAGSDDAHDGAPGASARGESRRSGAHARYSAS
jgi:hypothetical protein